MKNNNPTLHDKTHANNSATAGNVPVGHSFKLGLDVDLQFVVTAIQCERGAISLPQKFSRAQLLAWVRQQIAAGHAVHTVYEACGFGYTLHHALLAAGAHSIVTTPMRLSPERRRKNDRLDARELCVRLSRHLEGHRHELKPIRIPTVAEQERRELGRQREFWKRELRRLENHGRALRIEFEHETLPAGWAGPRKWKALAPACSEFVRGQLEPVVAQIRACQKEMAGLTAQIQACVAHEQLPTGLGALTVSLLDGEVCDWKRFKHRKAIGSYTGCCPSEHSSGGHQRFGHIDRHGNKHQGHITKAGNPRLRWVLCELAWRLIRYQPGYRGVKKWREHFGPHAAPGKKKQALVALARTFGVDWWRLCTGRTTPEKLGLVMTAPQS